MRVLEILKEENEGVKERYELARQRIAQVFPQMHRRSDCAIPNKRLTTICHSFCQTCRLKMPDLHNFYYNPIETIKSMADTYTDGYVRGFAAMGADFSVKSIVNIRYALGFERMILYAIKTFEGMDKKVTIHRTALQYPISFHTGISVFCFKTVIQLD